MAPEAVATLPSLTLVDTRPLEVPEPSGLTFGSSGKVLWSVSNRPERVYRLAVDGEMIDSLSFVGEDIEGIVFDRSDSTLWIVEERSREVVHVDGDGRVLQRLGIELVGKTNSGLEGITMDSEGNLFVLNEKKPGLLIALAADLSIRAQYELDFAKDYSGLAYDRNRDAFWVSSHEDRCLHLWSVEKGLLAAYSVPFDKIEGVAVDESGEHIYLVSEKEQTLYVYAVDQPK